jgi:hypothetical protein
MRVVDRSFDHELELEEHATMPLAGGINNHGYQCGMLWGSALGTAIWIIGMNGRKEEARNKVITSRVKETSDRFIKSKYTDFEFECSKITGRNFKNASDHADYLYNGGCPELIDLLATKPSGDKRSRTA